MKKNKILKEKESLTIIYGSTIVKQTNNEISIQVK